MRHTHVNVCVAGRQGPPCERKGPSYAIAAVLLAACGLYLADARIDAQNAAPSATLIEDLVAANRIVADQGIVDGYGHNSRCGSSGSGGIYSPLPPPPGRAAWASYGR